ncbi:MAG: FAD-dependent thymidylate synthase [Thermovirgaceae bacterium]|nr:FAD-dependent thymidylate synthase [Thermovirgaceae bacterium]
MAISVLLVASTPEPDRTVAAAARLCYSDASAGDLVGKMKGEDISRFIDHLRGSGHLSPFEHAVFTFAVDGISRVCTHQLVRHRLASYSQQSQRYVEMKDPEAVVPPSISSNPAAREIFDRKIRESHEAYKDMIAAGIPREDARYILPHGWMTKIVVTMNARELHHFFSMRLCRRAQWEIRCLAREMLAIVRDKAPCLFSLAGPDCVVRGRCFENRPCGSPFSNVDEVLSE